MFRARDYGFATLLFVGVLAPALAEEPFLSVAFGPGTPQAARRGARAAASAARRWLQTTGALVEIRAAGNPEAKSFRAGSDSRQLDAPFEELAISARDADPAAFLTALDAAVQSAAQHAGPRVVIAALNSPPWSSEAERTLRELTGLCRTHSVRVIVLDILEGDRPDSNAAMETLAKRTGGLWLRQSRALEPSLFVVTSAKTDPSDPPAIPADPAASSSPFAIPVYSRFIRTSSTSATSSGSTSHIGAEDQGAANVKLAERPYEANDSSGPMRGLVMVETPLSALKFEEDANAGSYLARARLTVSVRNSKGDAVWSGQKEMTIRGPLRKLDARREGSLLFMRNISLLGNDRYSLDAKVDDLIAAGTGAFQGPLRPGRGVPGLMASDALFVRPFKGGADRFEADEVFAYEGEALSPVLHPLFPSGEAVDLQLYFVIYPDINGPQPELSMELSRGGKIVARMPLQFKTELRNVSTEGKFGTMPGTGSILGGRARQFPYLANLKGAKLSPGAYQAVVSIRQGRRVITRDVSFTVSGTATEEMAELSGSRKMIPAEDLETILMPEIAPATISSSGLAVSGEEQKRLWDEAAGKALGYSSHLPNFRCTQETHRLTAPIKAPGQLKELDSFKDELTFEDGKESYRIIEINRTKVDAEPAEWKGVRSRGEFGSMLAALFDPERGAAHQWAGRSLSMGVLCQVFEVDVAKDKSNFTLTHNGDKQQIGYTGRVFIEEETGLVRRITIQGVDVPKGFGLQTPSFLLEYGMVKIGAEDYLLPLRSVLQVRQLRTFVRNETTFRGYRKFDASVEIKFQTP